MFPLDKDKRNVMAGQSDFGSKISMIITGLKDNQARKIQDHISWNSVSPPHPAELVAAQSHVVTKEVTKYRDILFEGKRQVPGLLQ